MAKRPKQQSLQDLMDLARAQREGGPEAVPPQVPAPTPKKQAPKAKATPAKTRDDMFALFKKAEKDADKEVSPRRVAPAARPRPSAPEAAATGQKLQRATETYDDFNKLLSGSRQGLGKTRVLTEEVLRQGSLLPNPRLADLDGVPYSFENAEALAINKNILVLLASTESIMASKLRDTLLAFSGSFPAAKFDAALAAVSRVPPSSYRKLNRKAGVDFPLLSDPDSLWLSSLNLDRLGAVAAFIVRVPSLEIVASFSRSEPATLVRKVRGYLEAREKEEKEGAETPPEGARAAVSAPSASSPAAPSPAEAGADAVAASLREEADELQRMVERMQARSTS